MAGIQFLPEVVTEPASRSEAGTPAKDRAAGSVPAVPRRLVFRRNENALVQPECSERLPRVTRVAQELHRIDIGVMRLVRAGKIRDAVIDVALDLAAESIAKREMIDRLDDRIAALEAAAGRV